MWLAYEPLGVCCWFRSKDHVLWQLDSLWIQSMVFWTGRGCSGQVGFETGSSTGLCCVSSVARFTGTWFKATLRT